MATKKHQKMPRTRTKKSAHKSARRAKSAPKADPNLRASKLQADLDAAPQDFRPLHADKAQALEHRESQARSAGQSGSLQGLSDLPDAAPESVDELLEEGNALEAGVVEGVEDAHDADQGEIKTREVAEDDVPDEYLDNEP